MKELEELRALSRPRKGPRCGLFGLKLSAADAATLKAAVDDPGISSKVLAGWLGKRGIVVTFWTVARHRRHDCACPA